MMQAKNVSDSSIDNTSTFQTREEKYMEVLNQELIKNFSDPFIREQYKLLIDSAHKISERNKDSNSIYIGVSSIFIPFLIKFFDTELFSFTKAIGFSCMITVGIIICLNWLRIVDAYKNISDSNYLIIKQFEQHLPTSVFSLRAKMSDPVDERGSAVPYIDKLIPYLFIAMYVCLYIIFLMIYFTR